MAYQKKTWKDRLTQYPNRRTLTDTTTGTTQTVDVARAEGEVGEAGDAFSEENMNAMETRIDNAFSDKVLPKYGTCSTASATAAKEATLANKDDWKLATDAMVCIKFANDVPANATLNVESSGAKAIYFHGAAITADIIAGGDIATLIYDGTNYNLISLDTNHTIAGHNIVNASGTAMATEDALQFTGNGVSVSDDSVNGKTVVEVGASNTFAIATSDWTANSGSDATDFPYIAEKSTALYSSTFKPAKTLLLGADINDYPTSAEETEIALVDKHIKFTGTAIRLRATAAPASALNLVVRR